MARAKQVETPAPKPKAKAKLALQHVAPDAIHANPWNPNEMNERQFNAARESVGRFGFIDPVTVRPHPELDGQYQIVDGEHRWRVAQELGLKQVPMVVLDIDTPTAKKLTIVLNETRGEANKIDLAELLVDLQADLGDELGLALPYDDKELEDLVGLAGHDWRELDGQHTSPGSGGEGGGDDEGWVTITMRVPDSVGELWTRAFGIVGAEHALPDSEGVANGQVLEAVLADFLAGAAAGE